MVDKNLFLYDLAVVAILKNEGHYLKEWLDYHLLAGVDHFYLYDNDSPDNQAEVAAPYVEAGLVDYISAPGKVMQLVAYNDAVKRFKFQCRYMAFIDGDEFIYPKTNRSIVEVVDDILARDPNAAGLAINWQIFGSNGQKKADYSRGVLERFTRRAKSDASCNTAVKVVVNPRMTKFFYLPHCALYFEGCCAVNENGDIVPQTSNISVSAEKIAVNHYYAKSLEEFEQKIARGRSDTLRKRKLDELTFYERNEVFDDSILKYRAARAENFSLEGDAQRLGRVTEALTDTLTAYAAGATFSLETALTCRAVSSYLRERFPRDADVWQICEAASLDAILKSVHGLRLAEARLLIRELPKLLRLPYPAVNDLRGAALMIIAEVMDAMHFNNVWNVYAELDYIRDLLKD